MPKFRVTMDRHATRQITEVKRACFSVEADTPGQARLLAREQARAALLGPVSVFKLFREDVTKPRVMFYVRETDLCIPNGEVSPPVPLNEESE